jgi:hypothetical protein
MIDWDHRARYGRDFHTWFNGGFEVGATLVALSGSPSLM